MTLLGQTPVIEAFQPSNIISGLFIAIVTAVVAVKLSLSRFRAERLWEKKLDAYIRTLDAIHKVKRLCQAMLGATKEQLTLTESFQAQLNQDYLSGLGEIERACDTALLLLPQIVVDSLSEFVSVVAKMEINKHDMAAMQQAQEFASNSLKIIRKHALKDLAQLK